MRTVQTITDDLLSTAHRQVYASLFKVIAATARDDFHETRPAHRFDARKLEVVFTQGDATKLPWSTAGEAAAHHAGVAKQFDYP